MDEMKGKTMNKKSDRLAGIVLAGLVLAVSGCRGPNPSCCDAPVLDTVTQVSSYNGLLAALYDGVISYDKLAEYGDFGLGTFDKMDGEMVMLDSVLYQVDFNGKVNVMDPSLLTPYATLCNFKADQEIKIPAGLSYDEASKLIESKLKNPNTPYAIRIDGTFAAIKCRSVPAQEKPYPPLAEIAKSQSIFEDNNVQGTVVGFRYPKYAGALNVPGFHCHFLNDTRSFGGHILGFTTGDDVVAKVDRCTRLNVYIPDTEEARKADLDRDRSADVNAVNRSK